MPTPTLNFLLKILLASALLSIAIKYAGPLLPIPATDWTAGVFVLLPPIVVAVVLWRQMQSESSS